MNVILRKGFWLFLLIGVSFLVYPAFAKQQQAEKSIRSFFNHLTAERYEDAFKHVAYFDKYSDVRPAIPYDRAEKEWMARVKSLKEKGQYVQGLQNVTMSDNDGFPVASLSLIVVEDGKQKNIDSGVNLIRRGFMWKIVSFVPVNGVQDEVIKAISGDFREIDRK